MAAIKSGAPDRFFGGRVNYAQYRRFACLKACAIVLSMDAVSHLENCFLAPQLGASPILGTRVAKKPAILKDLVGAVGIEPEEVTLTEYLPINQPGIR